MAAVLFVICVLGCCACASVFREEMTLGKFNQSLLGAALGWALAATLTFIYLVHS